MITARVTRMQFESIPGYSDLYRRYLNLDPEALRFYQQPPLPEELLKSARAILAATSFRRGELAEILRRQNANLRADESSTRSIDELEQPDSVAVLTGQQVGLFGGPLYTIYKAMTAIRLAAELRSNGLRAVPVFWMECEDHDLAEVTRNTVFAPDSSLRTFEFGELLFGEERTRARPVVSLSFDKSIRGAFEQYLSCLSTGPSLEEVRELLESTYLPGANFADAFGRLMARLLAGRGLVFYNPADAAAKRLALPVLRKALTGSREICSLLSERSKALVDAGFHAQVSVTEHSTTLFLIQEGERRALTREGDRIGLKNSEETFGNSEMSTLLENAPERFSPNVLLRPLVQDHLFPTAAYVAGPSELAYFAQLDSVYRFFGRSQPVIWPRDSFTLIEPELSTVMEKAGLDLADCFKGKQQVAEKLMESIQRTNSSSLTKALGEEIEQSFQTVRPAMVAADASLGSALDTAKRKMLHHVQSLQARFVNLETVENDSLGRTTEQILNFCYPNRVMQEREFGIHQFIARHGVDVLDTIASLPEPGRFAHIVASLE